MPKLRWFLVPLICCWLAQPAAAVPFVPDFSGGPVVFDFEDGLQAWSVKDSVQRVQTQVLGGEWAIFGDGLVPPAEPGPFNNGIWMEMDATNVALMSFEQFFAGDAAQGTNFVRVLTGGYIMGRFVGIFHPLGSPDPIANPGLRTVDMTRVNAVSMIGIVWSCFGAGRECPPNDPAAALGFIDNITLYPIPEPGTGLLLIIGLAGLAAAGRQRRFWIAIFGCAAGVAASPGAVSATMLEIGPDQALEVRFSLSPTTTDALANALRLQARRVSFEGLDSEVATTFFDGGVP